MYKSQGAKHLRIVTDVILVISLEMSSHRQKKVSNVLTRHPVPSLSFDSYVDTQILPAAVDVL